MMPVMILRMAGPSLMSRDRHVPSRRLFVAGTITSYAAAKQQEQIMLKGDALTKLVADFNRDWPEVKRSRETLVLAQEFGA
jgi:hypothetical protein